MVGLAGGRGRAATPGGAAYGQASAPAGGTFDRPIGLAVDGDSNVYVSDSGNHRIQKLSPTGEFLATWGTIQISLNAVATPMELAVSETGRLYAAYLVPGASASQIRVFDLDGKELGIWKALAGSPNEFLAQGIAAGAEDRVYVTDAYGSRVLMFDTDGGLLGEWGSAGTGDEQFADPLGMAVGPDSSVYVVDGEGRRVQQFDTDGVFLAAWSTGEDADLLVTPWFIAVDPATGTLFVTMAGPAQLVRAFDPSGQLLREWGGMGEEDGQFSGLAGVAVDGAGNVLVADSGNNRIQRFTVDGEFIDAWGATADG